MDNYEFAVGYSPRVVFSKGFAARQQTVHNLSAGVAKEFPIGEGIRAGEIAALTPSLTLERNFVDPSAASSTAATLGVQFAMTLSSTVTFAIAPGVTVAAYDQPTNSISRTDFRFNGSIGLNWKPSDNVTFSLSANVLQRISTAPDIDMTEFAAGPSVGVKGLIKF